MEIKNIIFDLGGVLLDLDKQRCIQSFKNLGLHLDDEKLGVYGQYGLFGELELGEVGEDEFYEKFRDVFKVTLSDEQIEEAWNSFLIGISNERLELLKRLKSKYNLYLLTNTSKIHHDFWDRMFVYGQGKTGAQHFFDKVFCSYKQKVVKPKKEAFVKVFKSADINPKESLYFDDSLDNCNTASDVGLRSVHVKSTNDVLTFDWDV